MEEVERQMDALVAMPEGIPKAAREVWQQVKKTVKNLHAETMLKYAFLRQQERFEKILEQENKFPTLLMSDTGTKAISTLKDIAAEIRKLEVGQQLMRSKGMPYGALYPEGLLPPEEKSELKCEDDALRDIEAQPTEASPK